MASADESLSFFLGRLLGEVALAVSSFRLVLERAGVLGVCDVFKSVAVACVPSGWGGGGVTVVAVLVGSPCGEPLAAAVALVGMMGWGMELARWLVV